MPPRYLSLGDCALTVEFGDVVDRELSRRVMSLHVALNGARPEGMIESVPTSRSLTIHYDPLRLPRAALIAHIEVLSGSLSFAPVEGRVLRLPVCYERPFAPDLDEVAAATGLAADEVVHRHAGIDHYVYMIGFAPGHPYLGDLPEELTLPRRQTPRAEVPAGTLAIAVGLSVIYPFASPSGWYAIGRTPVRLFAPERTPPALLAPGDTVRFERIDAAGFERIAAAVDAGEYVIEADQPS